ncbi:MAG: DUF692 domain-containing protein [Candidatus Eisenbacteria bacterium]|nr:DUF692 domain-containing protein [Candidatus Eisenbacteria bacterium]
MIVSTPPEAALSRVGLAWREELAHQILCSGGTIDLVEVIAEDWILQPRARRSALRTLAAQIPIVIHGVGLGLASAAPVSGARLGAMAELLADIRPGYWSEHLAFVRGGGVEVGHLAAPPRTAATVDGTLRNLRRVKERVGSLPLLENVASLIDPPASDLSEAEWIGQIIAGSGAGLLLDLHNLYSNAINTGVSPRELLHQMPLDAVRSVHLAGGKWVRTANTDRWLDDHRHAVPAEVFGLLEELASAVRRPFDVVVEWDGNYPPFEQLLAEVEHARGAVVRGRARSTSSALASPGAVLDSGGPGPVTIDKDAIATECFLARLYTDSHFRHQFLAEPAAVLREFGFPSSLAARLLELDRPGLELMARSLTAKRQKAAI